MEKALKFWDGRGNVVRNDSDPLCLSAHSTPCVAVHTVPDVGSLVEYGLNSFQTGPAHYRVTAWMRVAPTPVFRRDDFIGQILFEACQEIPDAHDGAKKRMQFCLQEEATHLSLAGIAGAIAPIELCKVTGMVDWPKDQIEECREKARRMGAAHEMIF